MNKRSARAILKCAIQIQSSIKSCLEKLEPEERQYAEAYWAGNIENLTKGQSYGCMPIGKAECALDQNE